MKWYISFEIFVETEFLAVYTISIDFNGQISFPRNKDFESEISEMLKILERRVGYLPPTPQPCF